MAQKKKKKKAVKYASNWLNASIVGIQFPVAMAIGYFWGKWMDGLFGTEPWLTIIFFIFGLIAGFVNLFRITMMTAREEERLSEEYQDSGDGPEAP
jgi:ATP synthase protein I